MNARLILRIFPRTFDAPKNKKAGIRPAAMSDGLRRQGIIKAGSATPAEIVAWMAVAAMTFGAGAAAIAGTHGAALLTQLGSSISFHCRPASPCTGCADEAAELRNQFMQAGSLH